MRNILLVGLLSLLATSCAIKAPISNKYRLTQYSSDKLTSTRSQHTLLITSPEAVEGYQSEQMIYSTKPFALNSFTKNGWISTPAGMLYPLLIQSLQQSGYFRAIASSAYADKTDYRLDTQLIELQQNFTIKPSVLQMKIKAVVTRVSDNRMISSRTFRQQIPCSQDTPYGGVIAANRATCILTKAISQFTISSINHDH